MLIDLNEMPDLSELDYDVCVVGTGPAAISFALQYLEDTNQKVVMIESGGLEIESDVQELYEGASDGIDLPNGLAGSRLRFFGGSSNCWGGACTPLDEIDFEHRDWVSNSGWPIQFNELLPYYATAQKICSVGSYVYDDRILGATNQEKKIPFSSEKLETGYWRYSANPLFGEYYLNSLKKAANITVILHANATHLEVDPSAKHVKNLRVQSLTGIKGNIRAKNFVLACGGIENARILLYSNKVQREGLGNGKDLVGRYFMDHPIAPVATIFGKNNDERLKLYNQYHLPELKKNGINYNLYIKMSPAFQKENKILNSAAFITDHEEQFSSGMMAAVRLRQAYRQNRLPKNLSDDLNLILSDLDDIIVQSYNRFFRRDEHRIRLALKFQAEQEPNRDSRVQLSNDLDALGLPATKLTWKASEIDRRTIDVLVRVIAAELGKLNIARTKLDDWVEEASSSYFPSDLRGGVHHTGTTRMSHSIESGVVDENCRVHSIDNLFIAGSSIFPTNSWANPTLTICCLSVRLARHIMSMTRST